MAHPNGAEGETVSTRHTFSQTYAYVQKHGIIIFRSMAGRYVAAKAGYARDKTTKTIIFNGNKSWRGSVCMNCWGYKTGCNQSHTGKYLEALDRSLP